MFELQKLVYFTEGNTYSGSKTENGKLLRYRVEPDRENGLLLAWCWHEDKCFQRAGEKEGKRFPLNEEGLDAIPGWLEGHFADRAEVDQGER